MERRQRAHAVVIGTVRVSSSGAQGRELLAAPDLVLHAGDVVKTDQHANAVLAFADGTHLTLLSESILRFDKLMDYSNGTSAAWHRPASRYVSQPPSPSGCLANIAFISQRQDCLRLLFRQG